MPVPASLSLQKAIHAALVANTALTALLSGPHILDHVPRSQQPPYVIIAAISSKDWNTDGQEHIITLHAWSDDPGRRQLYEILGEIRSTLHAMPLTLEDNILINLRFLNSETMRDRGGRHYQAIIRFRAVTEPSTQE